MKVLVIDDNEEFSLLVGEALREKNFEVHSVLTGAEGIKAALATRPDLILLDYELGDMCGHDVAVAIRCMRATARIPFILLSSRAEDPMLLDGFDKFSSCVGAIGKGVPMAEIVGRVEQVCAKLHL